ncbi:MAG TPA: 3' terminal RNA ribose 2'-O-methyltransferase Hen1 [Pyrinomonadaceae bacterium]|jgi:3' terminal RNA ribose 2'-O-methyltransferase Hen1|nr:3' terminal RNA ribose 2'-O-methyltransferase Hen1 [Pyrinomonadaceae bacterium]
MLLTITCTTAPATDLGYLLHKNPARLHSFPLSFGQAHVFYPEATNERCTAALLLDVDPVGLVRNRRGPAGEGGTLDQYVNDRPYVASSFLSVAIARVLGSALGGRSKGRPALTDVPLSLTARLSVLPSRGGEKFLRRLFEPLGYEVAVTGRELDHEFPEWGSSSYYTVELQGHVRLQDLLTHLYVLIPVLDNEKHYWVGDDEVEKLLRHGSGWLAGHPEREEITKRYLKYRRDLAREAMERLVNDELPDPDEAATVRNNEEEAIERPLSLNEQRISAVLAVLKSCGAKRVVDLGCGEGKLLRALLDDRSFDEIVGLDVSHRTLQIAQERLKLERLPARQRERLRLIQGSLMYRDKRLAGYDAATVIEVIEHLDEPRLAAFERVLFEFARPAAIVLTTPNVEYNARFETLPAGKFRHRDHRFEWTRVQFKDWAERIAGKYGYGVKLLPVGSEDPSLGAPTQMAVFNLSK